MSSVSCRHSGTPQSTRYIYSLFRLARERGFAYIFNLPLPISLTADTDFSTAGFPQEVTIPSGQTSVKFNVTVIDELIVERDEQFQVSFNYSGGQPGVLVRPNFDEATITIRNDDG